MPNNSAIAGAASFNNTIPAPFPSGWGDPQMKTSAYGVRCVRSF